MAFDILLEAMIIFVLVAMIIFAAKSIFTVIKASQADGNLVGLAKCFSCIRFAKYFTAWFRCQHGTEMHNYAGKKAQLKPMGTIGLLHILPPKFSSRGVRDLILSVK